MIDNKKLLVVLDQFIVSLSNFFISYYLALKLNLEYFGIYSLFFAVLMLVFSFYNAALFQPYQLASEKNRNINKQNLYFFTSVILIFLQFILIIYLIFTDNFNFFQLGFIFYLAVFILHEMNRKILLTEKKYLKLIVIDTIGYGLRVFLIFIFFYKSIHHNYLFCFLGISFLLALLTIKNKFRIYSFDKFRVYYTTGKWLVAISVVYWLGTQSNIFVLGYLYNVELVGIFSALLVPIGMIRIIQTASESYLLPILSKCYHNDSDNIQRHVFKESYIFYLIILSAYLLIFIFDKYFLSLFYQNKFDEYLDIFSYLLIYGFLQSIVFQISIYYKITDKTKDLYSINKIVLYISIPVSIVAIYFYSLTGLSFALIFISIMNVFLLLKQIKNV